ncbi:NUDIX hydrolase [Pinisolibacter sp.]|uniref:NUDIX hydrolase n=1 Tax=Pinisolibacter sp. TaxID=2172024 RepID=UPI002FDEAA3A
MSAPTSPPPFVVLSRETIWKGFCHLERVVFDLRTAAGGSHRHSFVIESHGHAAAVLAFDPLRREAVLVRQLRLPQALEGDDPMSLEIIAGLLDHAGEPPEETARREAMEEAGLALTRIEPIAAARSSPGLCAEKVWIYLAEVDLSTARIADGGGLAHEGEEIEVVVLPLADLAAMADRGDGLDMKTLYAVQTLRLERPELFAAA